MPGIFKVILAGDGGTGKTTLIRRFLTGEFVLDTKQTIGVEFARQTVKISEMEDAILQIWDFAGEERFRFVLPSYVAGSHGAIVVFDKTRLPTLYGLPEWLKIIRQSSEEIPVILVASKADLQSESPDYTFIERLRIDWNIRDYLETSSKSGENVEQAFSRLAERIIERGAKR
ncbi:MAG: Rab family GTPase [Promethearchaeota archaeon]